MVKLNATALNNTFSALSDPTRRQIIGMLIHEKQKRIIDIAEPIDMSLVAVTKHIKVLEKAEIVMRFKRGRETHLQLNPKPLRQVREWLEFYERFWTEKFSALEVLLDDEETLIGENADDRNKHK